MFRHLSLSVLALALVTIAACTTKDNPDEIRRRTAEATESVRRDTKAVVEGVKEGMGRDNKAININKASREDLLTLPGISEHEADHIIAERPYDDTRDLVRRHVLPQAEYDKISDRVIADRYCRAFCLHSCDFLGDPEISSNGCPPRASTIHFRLTILAWSPFMPR